MSRSEIPIVGRCKTISSAQKAKLPLCLCSMPWRPVWLADINHRASLAWALRGGERPVSDSNCFSSENRHLCIPDPQRQSEYRGRDNNSATAVNLTTLSLPFNEQVQTFFVNLKSSCYHSIQNHLSFHLLSKNIKIKKIININYKAYHPLYTRTRELLLTKKMAKYERNIFSSTNELDIIHCNTSLFILTWQIIVNDDWSHYVEIFCMFLEKSRFTWTQSQWMRSLTLPVTCTDVKIRLQHYGKDWGRLMTFVEE